MKQTPLQRERKRAARRGLTALHQRQHREWKSQAERFLAEVTQRLAATLKPNMGLGAPACRLHSYNLRGKQADLIFDEVALPEHRLIESSLQDCEDRLVIWLSEMQEEAACQHTSNDLETRNAQIPS